MVAVIVVIILVIAVVTGILAVAMIRKNKREGKQIVNYRAFFLLGVIWIPFSIVLMVVSAALQIPFYIGFPFLALGLVYFVIGLKNRDTWKIN